MLKKDMESPIKLYEYFWQALNDYASSKGYGVQRNIAVQAGVTEAFISQIMAGTNKASARTQAAIARACGFHTLEDMLQAGKSIRIKSTAPETEHNLIIQVHSQSEKNLLNGSIDDYRGIPLYVSGRLAAGANGMAFDPYEPPASMVVIYKPEIQGSARHNLAALKVGGDSMAPTIPRGAIVVVDLSDKEQIDGRIFVVNVPDGGIDMAAVKRVRRWEKGMGFVLISDNAGYPPDISILEWHRLCVGRVVWMSKDVRQA
ncbi:MAG: LexA family transcriptional regulator [Deltaproteobacteria bacterium]|nr:LexA family transcriptional regulator [Deltaproteobacteria bacterium]